MKRYLRDRGGATALLFGLTLPVICGFTALAIDFGKSQSTRYAAQAALDAAVLSAARKADATDAEINVLVQQFFNAHGGGKFRSLVTTLTGRLEGTDIVSGEVKLDVPTSFMGIFGFDKLNLDLKTKVTRSLGNVEIALVLDTTGSMAGTKLDNVKTAAKDLIDTIYALPNANDNVKVSLVPFAQYVNVGLGNRNASWMSVPADGTSTRYACWNEYPNATKSNCRMQTMTGSNDGVPFTYQGEVCDWDYGTAVGKCDTITDTFTWNGCAGARAAPLNIKDEQYGTRIPGIQNVACPSPLTPLTKDKDTVKDSITAMFAQGETYIPAGLVWGWRTLSNREPFTESATDPKTADGAVRKYIVLMTDGYNTKSPRYPEGDHEGDDAAASNELTRNICDNIKADTASKIDIFTIAFQVTDEPVKDILRYCATPGGAFFDAVDYSRLLEAFGSIGNGLSVARITQ